MKNFYEHKPQKTADEYMVKYATRQMRLAQRTNDVQKKREWKQMRQNAIMRIETEAEKVKRTGRY